METLSIKTIVNFKETKDGTVMPFGTNLVDVTASAEKVAEYFNTLKNIEAVADKPAEWNQTFEAVCQDRVFYTVVPVVKENEDGDDEIVRYETAKIVLLDDYKQVVINDNNTCVLAYAEDGDYIFETEELAQKAAYIETYNDRTNLAQKLTNELSILKARESIIMNELEKLQQEVYDIGCKVPEIQSIITTSTGAQFNTESTGAASESSFVPADSDDNDAF